MKKQCHMFYEEKMKIAERDKLFMELVNDPYNPMTKKDLKTLIRKRPNVYGKYVKFLDTLEEDQQ